MLHLVRLLLLLAAFPLSTAASPISDSRLEFPPLAGHFHKERVEVEHVETPT